MTKFQDDRKINIGSDPLPTTRVQRLTHPLNTKGLSIMRPTTVPISSAYFVEATCSLSSNFKVIF